MSGRRFFLALSACLSISVACGGTADYGHPALRGETRAAAERFEQWLLPWPFAPLTLVEVPWYDPRVGTASDRTIFVPRKWLASSRDGAASRAAIRGLSQAYWEVAAEPARGPISDGVRQYTATRAIHEQLVGAHYFTVGHFGGFVTQAIRPVALSRIPQDPRPPVRQFPAEARESESLRVVDAMFTLERYIGWPPVQYAIADWLRSPIRGVRELEDSLWRATAQDLRWFTSTAFDPNAHYDYALTALSTTPVSGEEATFESTVTITRLGSAIFPIDIEIAFADGTRVRERWDGREPSSTFQYSSRSAATAAIVDPDLVLLLDGNRANNARVLAAPIHVPAIRWTMQWAVWLQDLLLTTTSLM